VVTVSTATQVTPDDVRAVIDTVPDPEMPPVSIGDLGMVHDVRVRTPDDPPGRPGARVEVDLIPTFTGCPATSVIRAEVAAAVARLEGVAEVDVRFCFAETWTPERISEQGRRKLRDFAIAHPGGRLRRRGAPPEPAACPICGSEDTVTDSPFGPTPCRSTHYCNACRNPFEAIKP
jgi:ring-1,2-phenylacetyl-CoA epoxidase subunit PaaD